MLTKAMDLEANFWSLYEKASRFYESSHRKLADGNFNPAEEWEDRREAERAMVEIIVLVEAHPEHRAIFVRCFSDIVLWKRPDPYMLVAFCMRKLRFPEIPELIHSDAEAHKGTAYYANHMNHWSDINHAYLDEVWESAICFEYYRNETAQPES